eukprot:EG_transcript_173
MLASWVRPLEHPPARWGHSAVVYGHSMLVFGGAEGSELNNDVVLFDLQPPAAHCKGVFCSAGSEKAPAPRVFHTAALWHSHMIVFGGWSAKTKGPVNDLFVWDCEKQTWSGSVDTAGVPPSPRMSHSAVVHGDRMVVFGGHNDFDRNAEVHILSIGRQPAWSGPVSTQGQVPRPVSNHTACLHGDRMLVFGDNGETSAVFSLDLAVSKLIWRHVEAKGEIPQPRLSHTATMVANSLVLLGGERLCSEPRQPPFAQEHHILDLATTPATWRRLPGEGSMPAARHMHTTVFHGSTMCLFMFGGTQTPSTIKKNMTRVKSLLSSKVALLRGLHILPLGFLITPSHMALPLDCALQSTTKCMKHARTRRAWFKDRIPQQFSRLAAFLHQDKDDCVAFIEDVVKVVALLERVTQREAALLSLQARIRSSGLTDEDFTLQQLVKERNAARRSFLIDAEELTALVESTQLPAKLEGMLVTHLGSIHSILALWDADCAEDKHIALITAKPDDEADNSVDVRHSSFINAMETSELILTSFLAEEARVAEELRRHTDGVARRLQNVLLRSIHDFMGLEDPSGDLDDVHSEDSSIPDDTADTLVRVVENLTADEEIWFARQPARAEPLVPQSRRVMRQLLRTLQCFETVAKEALVKIELLEKGLSSVKEHGIDPPRLEDFTGLVDEVDAAQRDFCLAFAELDSLRKLRRRDADRIAASEKRVAEVRRTLQTVQSREEVERMKLAVVLHEHWPEMLLSHPDLKLRDVLDRCRAEEVDGFLMAERSLEDYDVQSINTNGRHVVLQAKFEDREYALKEYVIQDLAVVKHEVRVLARLQHPNIVPCQALVVNEAEMKAYLQLPYYSHSMMEWVSSGMVADEDVRNLTAQVLAALSYLHARGVLHGNVRLENVLMDRQSSRAMLADFDISKPPAERAITVATSSTTPNGSVAPEVVAGGCGTAAADMWAFGYLLVIAQLRGRRPEHAIPQDLSAVMRSQAFATQLVDVLDNLFMEDPARRLTADAAMLYRWFAAAGLVSEKERLRRAVADVQRDRDLLRRGAIQLQVERQAYREQHGQLLERVEALTGRSKDLVASRAGHINTAQRLIFDLNTDSLNADLRALAEQWLHLGDSSDRLERLSREFAGHQREVQRKEQTILREKPAQTVGTPRTPRTAAEETPHQLTCRLFGLPPIYWTASGMRNLNPLVDVTQTWLQPMQDLVTSTESVVKNARGRQYRRHLVLQSVHHVENAALWDAYCAARDVIRVRVAQAVQSGHHNLLMALTTGRPWMQDLQLDSTINEKLLFCCAPAQMLDRARLGFGSEERVKSPGNFGYGIYFSSSASKAEAAKQSEVDAKGDEDEAYLVLARVCLGCPLTATEACKDTRQPPCLYRCHETTACAHPCFDSIVSDPTYTVYSGDLCYPEFILRYKVVSQEEIWSIEAAEEEKGVQQLRSTALKFTPEDNPPRPSELLFRQVSPGSYRQASPIHDALANASFLNSVAPYPTANAPEALTDRKPSLLEKLGPTSFKLGKGFGLLAPSKSPAAAAPSPPATAPPAPPQPQPSPPLPPQSPPLPLRTEAGPQREEPSLTQLARDKSWPYDGPTAARTEGPPSELSRAIHRRMGGDPGWQVESSPPASLGVPIAQLVTNRKPGRFLYDTPEGETPLHSREVDDPLSSPRQSSSSEEQSLYNL